MYQRTRSDRIPQGTSIWEKLGLESHQCTHVNHEGVRDCHNIVRRPWRGRPDRKCGVHVMRRPHTLSRKARKKKAQREGKFRW